MSTRTQHRPQIVIPSAQGNPANSGNMTLTLTSAPTVLQSMSLVSYGIAWTGTSPVGTITVQASNDCTVSASGGVTGGTWNTIPFLSSTGVIVTSFAVSGNTGNGMLTIGPVSFYACELVYTPTSGSGTLTVTVVGGVT
jgi:hypothetical protein